MSAGSELLRLPRCAWPGLGACVLLLLGACTAEPPTDYKDGSIPAPPAAGQEKYGWIVKCHRAPTCPGPSCEDNAEGAPNGNTVDLDKCGTMDVVFFGIFVEMTITFGQLGGTVRVESSEDGLRWVQPPLAIVQPPLPASKTARLNVTYNDEKVNAVSYLRLIHTPLNKGVTTVDGFEATSIIPTK